MAPQGWTDTDRGWGMANTLTLRPGQKLASAVSDAQLIVVRAPATAVDLRCGGVALLPEGEEPSDEAGGQAAPGEGLLIGKRYADDELGLEVLCTRSGEGELTVDGRPLPLKGAKPLPSSD